MRRLVCKACSVQFVSLRSDAKTCSPRCRKTYSRWGLKINAEMIRQKQPGYRELIQDQHKGDQS